MHLILANKCFAIFDILINPSDRKYYDSNEDYLIDLICYLFLFIKD